MAEEQTQGVERPHSWEHLDLVTGMRGDAVWARLSCDPCGEIVWSSDSPDRIGYFHMAEIVRMGADHLLSKHSPPIGAPTP